MVTKTDFRPEAKISGQWDHFSIYLWLLFLSWGKNSFFSTRCRQNILFLIHSGLFISVWGFLRKNWHYTTFAVEGSLGEVCSRSKWSFARGQLIRMMICKRPVDQDDHLQKADPSRWTFARCRSIRMIICKKPVNQDDHLQGAGWSRLSFPRGCSILMIICKRLIHLDEHL